MKMTTQNFRRTADTSRAGANVVNAWQRFGETLAQGISGIGGIYTSAKEADRADALATRQLDIAQQNATTQNRAVSAQTAKINADIAAQKRQADFIEKYVKAQTAMPVAQTMPAAQTTAPNNVINAAPTANISSNKAVTSAPISVPAATTQAATTAPITMPRVVPNTTIKTPTFTIPLNLSLGGNNGK